MDKILNYEERTVLKLRELYEKYGYRPYKMSKFEEYDLYAENKKFLVSKNVITFTDLSGKLMALKPDVTLSIIKNYNDDAGEMVKLCYDESVYRASGYDGGYQEITQTGLECIGSLDTYTISEVIRLAAESLSLIKSEYVLDVSHMGFVMAMFRYLQLSEQQSVKLLKEMSRKNIVEIRSALKGWGIGSEDSEKVCAIASLYGRMDEKLQAMQELSMNEEMISAVQELRDLSDILQECGAADNIYLDFSIAGETEYYNGVVFKGFVDGVPSAVLSGGRYDGLLEKLGKRAGAIGFAVYLNLLERLFDSGESYDVDVLLEYEDGTDIAALCKAVKMFTETGKSVRVQKGAAGKLRYRQKLRMQDKGVEIVETDD